MRSLCSWRSSAALERQCRQRAADATSSAILDLDARELRVASAAAHYRGQELKLLSPTQVSFANGVSDRSPQAGCAGRDLPARGRARAHPRYSCIGTPDRAEAHQRVHAGSAGAGGDRGACTVAGPSLGAHGRNRLERHRHAVCRPHGGGSSRARYAFEGGPRRNRGLGQGSLGHRQRSLADGAGRSSSGGQRRVRSAASGQARHRLGQSADGGARHACRGQARRRRHGGRRARRPRRYAARSPSRKAIGAITCAG